MYIIIWVSSKSYMCTYGKYFICIDQLLNNDLSDWLSVALWIFYNIDPLSFVTMNSKALAHLLWNYFLKVDC